MESEDTLLAPLWTFDDPIKASFPGDSITLEATIMEAPSMEAPNTSVDLSDISRSYVPSSSIYPSSLARFVASPQASSLQIGTYNLLLSKAHHRYREAASKANPPN